MKQFLFSGLDPKKSVAVKREEKTVKVTWQWENGDVSIYLFLFIIYIKIIFITPSPLLCPPLFLEQTMPLILLSRSLSLL
jgi:hypothetical protein